MIDAPAVVAGYARSALLTRDGELLNLANDEVVALLAAVPPPLLIHAPATLRRLGAGRLPSFDLLELFAFVHPARPVVPTPRGLALALDLPTPSTPEQGVTLLAEMVEILLDELQAARETPANADAAGLAIRMGRAGWLWTPAVIKALGEFGRGAAGLKIWRGLPAWEEAAPTPPPGSHAVAPAEARERLGRILGPQAEQRPGQSDYAHAAAAAFAPRTREGDPPVLLAEAGTGTGKTLGYIAPASLWAERNHGTVWISTFTRHLQRQIQAELIRLFPDAEERARRVVVRKGRENYLCLLNFEDATINAAPGPGGPTVALGLIARWAVASRDGDIAGGDLPGWFAELFGSGAALGLADRRGECIHGACTHYRRCFVEHTVRRARTADLVIANHALVMAQAAWGGLDDDSVPTRYVFDEGHHLFEAADSAFAVELSGLQAAELRRWLLGAEGSRSRARGLYARLDDLVVGRRELEPPLLAALHAARALPAPGWSMRLVDTLVAGSDNPSETFLRAARAQLLARVAGGRTETLECDVFPTSDALADAAVPLERALAAIAEPLRRLMAGLQTLLDEQADELDTTARERIEAVCRTLRRRALDPLTLWRAMLKALGQNPPEPGERPAHIHFLRLDRRENQDRDIALLRHHLDPTLPFALSLVAPAHGVLVTSATLRDSGSADAEEVWAVAEARVGATHLPSPALRASVASPFDYVRQTRAFVVTDVAADPASLAPAYRELFLAAGGGGLGLFTAIARLRAVHRLIAPALAEAGIALLAQHVDAMDNATLVDVFRTEPDSCLLGTDAMRDGVDVPGRALRLVVFERVPWPRPDILHRERRIHLSGGDTVGFDDRIARMRLRQAFGRLIRTATDTGVFVLLDRRTPTRLLSAFPTGVEPRRVGLAEAVAATRGFLGG